MMKLAILSASLSIMTSALMGVEARSAILSSVGARNIRLPPGDEYVSVIQRSLAEVSAASTSGDVFKAPLPTKKEVKVVSGRAALLKGVAHRRAGIEGVSGSESESARSDMER